MLPSLANLEDAASQNGFLVKDVISIGSHYVKTLEKWKSNLKYNWHRVETSGFDIEDYRRFEYYFSYCSGAFSTAHIDNHQLSLSKAR